MALLRIGGLNSGKRREELLASYEGEEPYMPGGYETPYNGEEPWRPEGYEDSPYDDEPYEGEYDDDYGYDAPYGDGSRYDDDYGYDDAYGYDGDDYPPEDDEYYDRPPYYDAPGYAPEGDYPEEPSELQRYMDEHDWVTWLLLVLVPPAGIWLVWRRRRYSQTANVILTLLSALWLAALVAVLVLNPFKPVSETTITPQPVGASAVSAEGDAEAAGDEEAAPEASEGETAELISAEEVDEANAVYVVTEAPYYHQSQDCTAIGADVETTRLSRNTAIEKSLLACPYCMGSQYSDGMWDLVFVNAETEDRSGMKVYCSAYNTHFHTKDTCSDISGDAHEVSLKDALMMAKTACDVCCPDAGREVYCTLDGTYYHVDEACSGMRDASKVTYAEARVTGKKRCPVCIGGTDETEEAAAAEAEAAGYYVYATPKGTYYHVNSTCSGMKDAKQVLLADMLRQNRPACPVCCPDAETTVFAQAGNPYYHSYATCSGMTNATQGILVNALAKGLTRCPECWTQAGSAGN